MGKNKQWKDEMIWRMYLQFSNCDDWFVVSAGHA